MPTAKTIWLASDLEVRKGDLVLRDRGYFTPVEFQRIMEAQGDFVSRYKHKTTLTHPETGEDINFLRLLKTEGTIDRTVLIGKDSPVEVRLLATQVSQEMANRRRQKAKKENRGHNPSKDVLFLLGHTIFFTRLTDPEIDISDFLELYGLRWRIENIFKTWKSDFNFDKIHEVGENQLRLILMARFMAITLIYEKIYVPLSRMMLEKNKKRLSLMKLMRYLNRNFNAIAPLLKAACGSMKHLEIVEKYCAYDKRKRPNYPEKEARILTILEATVNLS